MTESSSSPTHLSTLPFITGISCVVSLMDYSHTNRRNTLLLFLPQQSEAQHCPGPVVGYCLGNQAALFCHRRLLGKANKTRGKCFALALSFVPGALSTVPTTMSQPRSAPLGRISTITHILDGDVTAS